MIQPQQVNYQGVIGGTFNNQITLFQGNLEWVWYGVWQPYRTYPINATVSGSDSNLYVSLNEILENDNPVHDSENWQQVGKLNLTGWTGVATIDNDPFITTTCTLGGTAGTIGIEFTPEQTSTLAAGIYTINVALTDPEGEVYYPVIGSITFINPDFPTPNVPVYTGGIPGPTGPTGPTGPAGGGGGGNISNISAGNFGSAYTVNLENTADQIVYVTGTLTANCVITISNRAAGCEVVFTLIQGGSGNYTVAINDGTSSSNVSNINTAIGSATTVQAICPNSTDIYVTVVTSGVGPPGAVISNLSAGNLGSAYTVNLNNVTNQIIYVVGNLTANTVITLTNRAAGCQVLLDLIQGSGSYTISLSDGTSTSSIPNINNTAGSLNSIQVICPNSTDIYAALITH